MAELERSSQPQQIIKSTSGREIGQMPFVNRYVSNRSLEKNASIKSIILPPIQLNSINYIEESLHKINH